MRKVRFSRLELYDLVWQSLLHRISKDYNIPRAGIKNACVKMKIPLPVSNYWTKPPYLQEPKPALSADYFEMQFIEIAEKGYEL